MDQRSHQALTLMLETFHSTGMDRSLQRAKLLQFEEALTGVTDEAICEAARRFRNGEVPSQNRSFSPTTAEFVPVARGIQEVLDIKSGRILPKPVGKHTLPGGLRPMRTQGEIVRHKALMESVRATEDREKAEALEEERAKIRKRYGMDGSVPEPHEPVVWTKALERSTRVSIWNKNESEV